MDIVIDELNPSLRCVRLAGRLDMKGAGEIDMRFTSLTTTDERNVIVDMSGVDFLASIGMRLLLSCAKAKSQRGARLVLAAPQPLVREALETAGIDTLIPIHADQGAAQAALQG